MPKRKFSKAFEDELFHIVAAHDFAHGWGKRFYKQAELILKAYLGLLPHSGEQVERHYLWLNHANDQSTPEEILDLQEFDPLFRAKMEVDSLLEWFNETTGDRTPEEVEELLRLRGEADLMVETHEAIENWKRETEKAQEEPDDEDMDVYDQEMYERVPSRFYKGEPVFNEKRLSDAYGTSGRLDAEFYEPRFDELLEKLNRHDPFPLSAWCESVRRGLAVRAVRGRPVPIVNRSTLMSGKVWLDYYDGVSEKLFNSPEADHARMRRNDVLLVGKSFGTIGNVGIYEWDDPALASDEITILRPNATGLPLFLMLYLRSTVGQALCERARVDVNGFWELFPEHISRFLVPSFSIDLQNRLSRRVARSLSLRQEGEELFARSARAKAIAKSKGEDEGWKYLEKFPKAKSPWRGV